MERWNERAEPLNEPRSMSHPVGTPVAYAGRRYPRCVQVDHDARAAGASRRGRRSSGGACSGARSARPRSTPRSRRARRRPVGAGTRARDEEPDPFRLCFERDLDRIKHSHPWRRLAGKCQVFIAPEDDHLRTRLTHAVEVAQVATGIARVAGLCVPLTEAIALAHDCGHGPAGHASEEAFSPYVPGGYDHAVYGADVTLAPLNLCVETLDGVRNHSWRRPAPSTPEGEVVAWADRIAYVCHDFEDAVRAGILDARPTCRRRSPTSSGAAVAPGRRVRRTRCSTRSTAPAASG